MFRKATPSFVLESPTPRVQINDQNFKIDFKVILSLQSVEDIVAPTAGDFDQFI